MKPPLSIRIPDDLKARLKALAVKERRSVNNLINFLLEEALAKKTPASKRKGAK